MIYFYKIFCKDKNITRTFIESTSNIIEAYRRHEDYCNNKNNPDKYNKLKYKFIREFGGWSNWDWEIINECSEKDRYEMEYFYFKNNLIFHPKYDISNSVKKIPDDESNELVKYESLNDIPDDKSNELVVKKKNKTTECECGGKYTKSNMMQHSRTKIHLEYYSQWD